MSLDRSAADLTDRVAVVTGAAQGIGKAIAETLAAFGADVAICDRETGGMEATAAAIEATGRRAHATTLDVRDADGVQAWADAVGAELGAVDVLVNNAGGGFVAPMLEIRPNGINALISENFTSVVHCVRSFVPLMTRGGSIVNVTSIEAFRAAPGFSIYSAMKAAVEQLTRTLALELADARIRVNCLAPDAIPTPGIVGMSAATVGGGDGDGDSDGPVEMSTPLGTGDADDCAGAVVFLASALSNFVTGSTVHVNGGTLAASGWRRGPEGRWQL
jgi:NAD(P)-dependent dehydrogenase (short-subunit alcohol dehydrogenase family)